MAKKENPSLKGVSTLEDIMKGKRKKIEEDIGCIPDSFAPCDGDSDNVIVSKEQIEHLKRKKEAIIEYINQFRAEMKSCIDTELDELINIIKEWNRT